MKETIKNIVALGCTINTVLITVLYLFAAFAEGFNWIPKLSTMFMILAVSFVVAAAEQIFKTNIGFGKKVLLHFGLCLAGFMLIFVAGSENRDRGAQILIAAVFFTLVYFLVNSVRFVIMGKKERRLNEEKEYTPAFKK